MNKKRTILFRLTRSLLAIAIALIMASLLIFISTGGGTLAQRLTNTGSALRQLIIGPIFRANGSISTKSLTDVLAAMIPTIFTGLAVCVMFSANQFNMGGEGGAMLGAFIAGMCAIYLPLPAGLHPVVCVLAGAAACGLMMLIPGILKARLNVSEMVCSLMLNYVIMYLLKYLMNTHLADKTKGQLQSAPFLSTAQIPQLVDNGSKLSWGFLIALAFVALTALFLYRTRWGYTIRMIGVNQSFAQYAGMRVGGAIVLAQVLGGVLAGLGGGIEMLGRYSTYSWSSLPGYGWTGITIAILAGNNPVFVPLAAFFMAYLSKGCNLMSTYSGVPSQLIDIIQAVIFLFFAAEQFLSGYRQKLVVRTAREDLTREQQKAEGGEIHA